MNPKSILQSEVILDARSPAEYERGHIPGAVSFPLFSNDERHSVGLCYKKNGRDEAVKLGLELVGPKLKSFVEKAGELIPNQKATMYCWRGGMRSQSMAWLLNTAGFRIETINGGYKTWRKAVRELYSQPLNLMTLGGFTGTQKTEILAELKKIGEQVIDLESLANHRGSAFGIVGEQPSTEHFENLLAKQIAELDPNQTIWVEDESRSIGKARIPDTFFNQKLAAPMVFVESSIENRIATVCATYGEKDIPTLQEAFKQITRRMGGQHVKAAIEHLDEGKLEAAAQIALDYYDKAYEHAMNRRSANVVLKLDTSALSPAETANKLVEWKKQQ